MNELRLRRGVSVVSLELESSCRTGQCRRWTHLCLQRRCQQVTAVIASETDDVGR